MRWVGKCGAKWRGESRQGEGMWVGEVREMCVKRRHAKGEFGEKWAGKKVCKKGFESRM